MLNFFYFPTLSSTQTWLVEQVKKGLRAPACVMCDFQTQGRGSRDNVWENVDEALMFSFVCEKQKLPPDLPMQSVSIYFGFLFKEYLLSRHHSPIWLKWPNDFYLQDQKVGGILTQDLQEMMICGIGLNLISHSFASIDVHWGRDEKKEIVQAFLEFAFEFPSWSYIFENYKIEFQQNFGFTFHLQNREISFRDVELCDDGALLWKNQKIYSLR